MKGAWRFAGRLKDVFAPEGKMLKAGDTIKCNTPHEMAELMTTLAKEDIETDFLYEKDGKRGYWLEIKNCKGSIWDDYEYEGQMNITDFPEVMP